MAGTAARCARQVCGAAALSHPAAQRATHRLYGLAGVLSRGLPLPLAWFVQPSAADQCTSLMAGMQFGLGALVPLLAGAQAEARLFQHHQLQRWRAGLPLERGAQAAVYDFVW